MRLHPGYTVWWLLIIGTALVAFLLGHDSITHAALAAGAGFELLAVLRKKSGDTLSEHVWAIVEDKPAMIPLALGFGLWLVWTALEALPRGEGIIERYGPDVGLYGLAAGVLVWLLVHFGAKGKWG